MPRRTSSTTLQHIPDAAALPEQDAPKRTGKGSSFWLAFLAIISSIFLSAMDLTAVSTILPTVTADLAGGDKFTWVGSAYALASTAILPLSGALADIFGRKPILIIAILLFSLGSALAGSAQNMNWLIGARTVQGIGGGAINFLSLALTADLVPFNERGLYQGIISLAWAFASAIGPPIGGAFTEKASWRWLFYLNLPITGIALTLVTFFLRVRTPEGSVVSKLKRVDWFGNLIVIAGSTLAIVGLTFGGVQFPWVSAQVLAPLIIGVLVIALFIVYEKYVPHEPAVPWEIISNRTTLGGYLTTMTHGIMMMAFIYYLPVYFQATLGAGPLGSSVKGLPASLIVAPCALLAGLMVHFMQKYKPAIALGWCLATIGFGILSMMKAGDPIGKWVGYQIIASVGIGFLFGSPIFAILADLPVERTAAATATFIFSRTFAQTWGVTIASTILQNELKKKLPTAFLSQFPSGAQIAYAAIPYIAELHEPLRSEVRAAFADSLSVVWEVMAGLGGLGIISVLIMKEVPMKAMIDKKYGLETGDEDNGDIETASVATRVRSTNEPEGEKDADGTTVHDATKDIPSDIPMKSLSQKESAELSSIGQKADGEYARRIISDLSFTERARTFVTHLSTFPPPEHRRGERERHDRPAKGEFSHYCFEPKGDVNMLMIGKYYGFEASILPFCNVVETQNFSSDPFEGGIVSAHGVDAALDAFLTGIIQINYDAIQGAPDDPVTDMSWMWQYCSEYGVYSSIRDSDGELRLTRGDFLGFYQRGDPNNPLSIETSFRSLELFQEECDETFPEGLPTSPQVEHVNKYGGWLMNPTHVLFTNGESGALIRIRPTVDPWRTMGLASIESNAPQRKPNPAVPSCNVSPEYPSFFGLTHADMVHVSDLRVLLTPDANHTDFQTVGFYSPISQEPFYSGLGLFEQALDEWLPCFGKSDPGASQNSVTL
ncbi:hypothetical protein NM688_g2562 [Phlebia brevispora]|uniref:Uncharacterized protein n=1 Tax=Phlebia brevispora TaxID=194682 RepID=A0ACC1T855_9APHY|nr:hypothetical protein NM688_g2562 [Phlebia brevispora]